MYERYIVERFNKVYIEGNFVETPNNKPNIELWEDLAGDDEIFHENLARVITNEDISYWFFPACGILMSRTTVQRVSKMWNHKKNNARNVLRCMKDPL